jgi:hypothetical protein
MSRLNNAARFFLSCLLVDLVAISPSVAQELKPISLESVVILVDDNEPSYIKFATKDLAAYISEIGGKEVGISSSLTQARTGGTVIAIGQRGANAMKETLPAVTNLGEREVVIRSIESGGSNIVSVWGRTPHATNTAIATLMEMIKVNSGKPLLYGPIKCPSQSKCCS